jgi:hypothetical protein
MTETEPAAAAAVPERTLIVARARTDGVAAVIAAFVGLLALVLSGYTAYIQRQQVRAQVWPYLEPNSSSSKRELFVSNKGVGPAIVRGVRLTVDGAPQRNWKAVFAALGLHYDHHIPYSSLNGTVISANDRVEQLAFPTDEDFAAFAAQGHRVNLQICYCSSLGECWLFDDTQHGPASQHQDVARCPAWGDGEFFDN